MVNRIGINWYARLQNKIDDLEHKLEDVQAWNKVLLRKVKYYERIRKKEARTPNQIDSDAKKICGNLSVQRRP